MKFEKVLNSILNEASDEDWVKKAKISADAEYDIIDGHCIWSEGDWEDGTWIKGHWKDGTFLKGTWKDGIWWKGIFAGTWNKGTWHNGTFAGKVWKDGTWEDGVFMKGTWKKGTFAGGWFIGGTFEKGTFEKGYWGHEDMDSMPTWKGGTWKKGRIYDPDKKGNFEPDWDWKDGYVESPIDPKEYFK